MQVVTDLWQGHQNATGAIVDPTVIFTTESPQMVQEQQIFVAENRQARYPFNFSFVKDDRDLTLISGSTKDIGKCWIRQWFSESREWSAKLLDEFCCSGGKGCRLVHAIGNVRNQAAVATADLDWELLLRLWSDA
jgi:hypothetical protein